MVLGFVRHIRTVALCAVDDCQDWSHAIHVLHVLVPGFSALYFSIP